VRARSHKAFTLTELVIAVSGIGVLATFVLPVTRQLEQRHRLTSCLGNLGQIGAASQAYAAEDARHQLVPIHAADVTLLHMRGWAGLWGFRVAAPHVFGGQTPTTAFPLYGTETTVMLDEHWGSAPNPWGAPTRPLNPYVATGGGSVQNFHCPADVGYTTAVAECCEAIPPEAAGISCFEMLGNSYRRNNCGVFWQSGSYSGGMLSVAPFGHNPDYILQPARTVLYSDPLFYVLVLEYLSWWPSDPTVGWHGFLSADNVAYCDGSARLTEIGARREFSAQELRDMYHTESPGWPFLRRGATWQMDCYPAPGALLKTYSDTGSHPCLFNPEILDNDRGWPYDRLTENTNPYGSGGEGR
jgi:type II secretory pathway pseudopilin PulG